MKKIYLIFFTIFIYSSGIACSFIPESFCNTIVPPTQPLIVSGEIISVDATGIDLKIIHVLRGQESRTTIRIWDGTDFECNGPWSMAAETIGHLNDSVVIQLPMITTIHNEWDVIGDFRRPNPYEYTSELKIKQGIVEGFIKGYPTAPSGHIFAMPYEAFVDHIINNGDCSDITISTDEIPEALKIRVNNPFSTQLNIQLEEVTRQGFVSLFSLSGEMLFREKIGNKKNLELATDGLRSGLYILEVQLQDNLFRRIKVVKI